MERVFLALTILNVHGTARRHTEIYTIYMFMTNDTSFLRKGSGLPSDVSEVMITFALEKI